jgi:two-component system sensor histidine kinase AtoS
VAIGSSLRSRFLIIVLAGAVIPLAATGYWLTNSSVRAAEKLLRTQLDTALATTLANVKDRWDLRTADLVYLAGNDASVRFLAPSTSHASAGDSAFLKSVYESFSDNFPVIKLSDIRSAERLNLSERDLRSSSRTGGSRDQLPFAERARIAVGVPATDEAGKVVGRLSAEMRLDAVLPRDSASPLVSGAELSIRDATNGALLRGATIPQVKQNGLTKVDGKLWSVATGSIAGLPLVFTLAAPADAFMGSFQRSARVGLTLLLVITIVAAALSVFFTAHLTQSLEQLANAADQIAAGNLSLNAPQPSGPSEEVRKLASSFQSMSASLQKTLQDLTRKEALAAVGEFAAGMSHEIRNGLSSVRLDLQRMDERIQTDHPAKPLVQRALRNVQRLNSSVSGALGVARRDQAKWTSFDLGAVLESAADAAEDTFAKSGGVLDRRIEAGRNRMIKGDAAAIEQLFVNVLLNAGQALEPGAHATLEVLSHENDQVEVEIRDDGIGMKPAELALIGQPFYSLKPGGTGLGLSIARKIVAAHGGDMKIESEPGKGTAVRVRLRC